MRIGQQLAQRCDQCVGIVVSDDGARAAAEELDRVGESGGDDRAATREGVDQHTGGDLVLRVVGQDDDGSRLDERGELFGGAVHGVEGHRIGDAEAFRLRDKRFAIPLPLRGERPWGECGRR